MRKGVFLAAAVALLVGGTRPAPAADERWVVVYSEKPAVTEFRDYGLVVLDSLHHPPTARGARRREARPRGAHRDRALTPGVG